MDDRGRGGHSGRPDNTGARPSGFGASQSAKAGTTDTTVINDRSRPICITGSRKQIQAIFPMLPAGVRFELSFSNESSAIDATTLRNKKHVADEDIQKKLKNSPKDHELIDSKVCGNCGAKNHKAAFCVKTGKSGWMEACPKCDSTKHMYEACPQRKKGEEDFIYLVINRQRKPPVKSMMKLGKVIRNELARIGTKWHRSQVIELPYSSQFARQEAQKNSPELWSYPHVGNPAEEAKQRVPERYRTNITLCDAANRTTLGQQAWSRKEEDREFTRPCSRGFDGDLTYPKRRNFRDRRDLRHLSPPRRRRFSPKKSSPRIKSERRKSPETHELLNNIRPFESYDNFSVDSYGDGDEDRRRPRRERHDRSRSPQNRRFSIRCNRRHEHHHSHDSSHLYHHRIETDERKDRNLSDRRNKEHVSQRNREEVPGLHEEGYNGRGQSTYSEGSGGPLSSRTGSRGVNGQYVDKDVE